MNVIYGYPRRHFAKGHYKRLRLMVGTQKQVAQELGVDVQTVSRRERGLTPITPEMEHAIRYLASDWGPLHWKETDPHTAVPMDGPPTEDGNA